MNHTVRIYKTTDFSIAAYLLAVGYEMRNWERDQVNPTQLCFIFDIPFKDGNPYENIQAYMEELQESAQYIIDQIKIFKQSKEIHIDNEGFRKHFMNIKLLKNYTEQQKNLKKIIYNKDKMV